MNLDIVGFFQNKQKEAQLMEAKYVYLRKLKLSELKAIADEYGIKPDNLTLQQNPRGAYGNAIAMGLDLDIIQKAVGDYIELEN